MANPQEVQVAAPEDIDVPHCVQNVPPVDPVFVTDAPSCLAPRPPQACHQIVTKQGVHQCDAQPREGDFGHE
ncbi:MAG TPA: hypothetical protein DEB20_09820 [Acidimicrobiaceae bacterium]|nr:hypothetical protein [Acidimicrobiaceae bacterium]